MSDYVIETRNLTKQYGTQDECFRSEYSCKERANLWLVRAQRGRKNHHYENVVRIDGSHIW